MPKIETLRELQISCADNARASNIIRSLLATTWLEFAECVEEAINLSLRQIAENPELKKSRSEDELTIDLVSLLKSAGFQAGHETKIGGHVDVVVRGPNDFLWLGEAKWHGGGYAWLYKGFQQLNTRYATGAPGQDRGGMIIYIDQKDASNVMGRWQAHLKEKRPDIKLVPVDDIDPGFLSTHDSDRSGRPYQVKHYSLSLYFDPKDNDGTYVDPVRVSPDLLKLVK